MHPDYKNNGYLVFRNFFDETTIKLAATYFDFKYRLLNFNEYEKSITGRTTEQDVLEGKAVAASYSYYGDQLLESIQLNYGQKACNSLRMQLSPTYSFARIYEKGSHLKPHVDRATCEISSSSPIFISDDKPSTLFISNFTYDASKGDPPLLTMEEIQKRGDYSEVNLYPGDIVFYPGCDRYHWRNPLESDYLVQFFMHFVDARGVFKDLYYDGRPYLGFRKVYKR